MKQRRGSKCVWPQVTPACAVPISAGGKKCQGDCTPGPACTDHLEERLITSRAQSTPPTTAAGGNARALIPMRPRVAMSARRCFSLSVNGVLGLTLRLDMVSQAVVVSVL